MTDALAQLVRQRARFICEYCRIPQAMYEGPFEIEHIVAVQHGGTSVLANLAYACLHCNRHKGTNIAGLDRKYQPPRLTPLFHPRRHSWPVHFRWDGPRIVGRTPVGRATVAVLAMNTALRVAIRTQLQLEGHDLTNEAT